jgi:3-hydroxybutyryl-CoA dehydrogenase
MSMTNDTLGNHVTVIGAGTMGVGIAQTFLTAGWKVALVDPSSKQLNDADATIARAQGDSDGRSTNLQLAERVEEVAGTEFVIESVPEIAALKGQVLANAESVLQPRLLCSNTSSLSISELALFLARPEHFVGMHFFQPVPATQLIELVIGAQTAPETIELAVQSTVDLGRKPIVVQDSPGFATSRLGVALGLEAMRMVEEGIATAADIDAGMVLGYQHGVGPLLMTDMVGLDTRLAISEHLSRTLGPRFEPPRILREKVARGELGRKSGQGFFSW